jgi:hypothetical protein
VTVSRASIHTILTRSSNAPGFWRKESCSCTITLGLISPA